MAVRSHTDASRYGADGIEGTDDDEDPLYTAGGVPNPLAHGPPHAARRFVTSCCCGPPLYVRSDHLVLAQRGRRHQLGRERNVRRERLATIAANPLPQSAPSLPFLHATTCVPCPRSLAARVAAIDGLAPAPPSRSYEMGEKMDVKVEYEAL